MLLSHYTSRSGLEGIASTGTLWATNFLMVNDRTEYFYAWAEIQRAAFEYVAKRIPTDLVRPNVSIEMVAEAALQKMRIELAATNGYGHLYVTSFAVAKTPHQETDGILTLWDRYTKLEGYCLQYDKMDIERMIHLDSTSRNYAFIDLSPIEYGMDKDTVSFKELTMQVGEQLVLMIAQQSRDPRVAVNHEVHWAPSYLAQKLMLYCGTRKDPAFEDERELRILAYPAEQADARVFTGIASKKTIHNGPNGKKHIVMGDAWRPGIEPKRIIIGPKANPNIEPILKLFENRPEVSRCNIPIV